MSLSSDLLEQAEHLAKREKKKPRQASLRRAVSAAYYALFHLLVEDAVREFLGASPSDGALRATVGRAFGHAAMKRVAVGFSGGTLSPKMSAASAGLVPVQGVMLVAQSFRELQEARHDADYDVLRTFSRSEALGLVEQAQEAFACWKDTRKTPHARLFLVALLVQEQIKGG